MSSGAAPIRAVRTGEDATPVRAYALLRMDPLLLLAALGLCACSLVTLKGATRTMNPGHPLYYVERQSIYFAIGLVVALALAQIDYSRLREFKYGLYGVMIALNLVVLGMPRVQGAARWIPLPFFQLQPSEFGKVLLIVSVSAFAVDRSRRLHERRTTARIMLLALIPAMIVIPQPDLGTGLVYVAVAFLILVFAGTSWKQLTALVAMFLVSVVVVLAVAPAMGVHVLKPYQVQRLTGFLNPSHDPGNQTYNITDFSIGDQFYFWGGLHGDQNGAYSMTVTLSVTPAFGLGAVPEPSSWMLMSAGLLPMFVAWLRGRRVHGRKNPAGAPSHAAG